MDVIKLTSEAASGMLSYDAEGNWRLGEKEVERFAAMVAAAELRRLHAEVESLRTDAERYRWLRDKGDSITVCDCARRGVRRLFPAPQGGLT